MPFRHLCVILASFSIIMMVPVLASGSTLAMTTNVPSGQPVGASIKWTTTYQAGMVYQYSVAYSSGPYFVMRDASASNTFLWTPLQEGSYTVRVTVSASNYQGGTQSIVAPFQILTRVTAGVPVVTATNNPLVALYSAPPCGTGSTIYVEFGISASSAYWEPTYIQKCSSTLSSNFYIAGMLASSAYLMRQVVTVGSTIIEGPTLTFTTGTVTQAIPTVSLSVSPNSQTSITDRVLLHGMFNPSNLALNVPFATNLVGDLIWYYNGLSAVPGALYYLTRPVSGGTMLVLADNGKTDDYLLEIDLAGNIFRETDLLRIDAQLSALGVEPIVALHDEARRFPNGQTLVLGMIERPTTGPGGAILGDMIIALDKNLQVIWTWDSFDHLSTSRGPVLGETCQVNYGSLCPAPDPYATDWLHSNSLAYTPDHNLLLSMRDQDWVLKIDYQDGTGPGDIMWTLGAGGDFTMQSADPYPWFSHQYDVNWLGTNQIILFDNGNTRCVFESPCNSRGQVLQLNEANNTVSLVFNGDLGVYASSFGSAQTLTNGNYDFGPGYIVPGGTSAAMEVNSSDTVEYNLLINASEYRTFRMQSLYAPPAGQ